MDGNKDDALKCLRIGKEALELGDRTRALKFLNKARRLDPLLPIDDLVSTSYESYQSPTNEPESSTAGSSSSTSPSSSTARVRVAAKGSAKESSKNYTEEQLTIVHQIKRQKDYYQILGLEHSCTVEDVRKAYRKLSLKVHPDKNKAPGAEEAFKAVSKAFQCLSNEETKKRYDLVGSEEPNYSRAPARQHHSHGFNGFYDDEFDPDEIFRNFFFGGGPQATTPFGTFHFKTGGTGMPNGHGVHGSGNVNVRLLLQMLPIILLILLNFLPSSDPIYTLSRNDPYEHMIETPRGVTYFVKSSAKFEQDYPYNSSERKDLERRVERDYVGVLSQNCRVELQRRQWGLIREMPHCNMLEKFQMTA